MNRTWKLGPGLAIAALLVAGGGQPLQAVVPQVGVPAAAAARTADAGTIREIRSFPTAEHGIDRAAGLAWSASLDALVVAEHGPGGTELLAVTSSDHEIGRASLPAMDGGSLVVDPAGHEVAFLSGGRLRSTPVDALRGRQGHLVGRAGAPVPVPGVQGAAYGDAGQLVLLARGMLVRVDGDDVRGRQRVDVPGGHDLRGLARAPQAGRLYTYDATAEEILALDAEDGSVTRRYPAAHLDLADVGGLTFAPSADATDHPSAEHLYLADAGRVVEASLDVAAVTTSATVAPTSVRTVATSAYAPPSPDPSGVTYLPGADRLLIVDGEVEEMSIYQGVNLWTTTRAGAAVGTGTTLPWSKEPTGAGFDPATNRLFLSDDSARRVFMVLGGADGRFGTSDDVVTHIDTRAFGSSDPEGVAYDGPTSSVWIVDGVNKEVYRVRAGPDGQPGTSDDVVSQFDLAGLGAGDPEGIDYDAVRDTLVVIDNTSKRIYELDRSGTLLNTVDITSVGMRLAAGVTVAPSTTVAGGRSFYAVDRGVDNDSNPTENDGRLYELAVDLPPTGGGGGVNQAPLVDAGADQTVVLPGSAALAGVVSDDGLPVPPGTVSTTWGKVSGPGTVSFADASARATTATFSDVGTYVLRLTASDGALTTSDEVTVTVQTSVCAPATGATQSVSAVVSAGSDDAEQRVSGSMDLSSSDLELVVDGSREQVVGLRFPGLAVPPGATVTSAYVQFRTDEVSTGAAALTVRAEATDDAPAYSSASGSVTSRATTALGAAWSPPAWSVVGEAGPAQRTPNLCAVVQAVVSRPGWAAGNAIAVQISGTGTRTAEAYEGMPTAAPRLHVVYTTGGGEEPVNQAPTLSAGPDRAVVLPASASLAGAVSDDGLPNPPGAVTTTWSRVSGPGAVTFADAAAPATTASFSAAGTYVLRLTASDGALTASDDVTVAVTAAAGPGTCTPVTGAVQTVSAAVASGADDGEQRVTGSMDLSSSDLELVEDGARHQVVGLRFPGLAVPPGATVTNAYVQLRADEVSTGPAAMTVRAEASDDAPAYTTASGSVTSRATTPTGVAWSPPPWNVVGEAGAAQRTPNLCAVVQAVVSRPGWAAGNALALQITGTGTRTAEAYEGMPSAAPRLHVEYTTGG